MNQAISRRKSLQTAPATRGRSARPAPAEHPLKIESRLRIEEADAHWRRNKEKIFIAVVATVILDVCVVSTLLIISKSSSPSDRQLAFLVMGQIIVILIGILVGKNIKWKG